jgi:choline dehydrogenase-like flavoprotein
MLGPFSYGTRQGRGGKPVVTTDSEAGFSTFSYTMRPESQGRLWLRSRDPAIPPHIWSNWLDAEEDRHAAVALHRYVDRMLAETDLALLLGVRIGPGEAPVSDDDIIAFLLQHGGPASHAVGTCRMGSDPHSVVDSELRVRGVHGLRVADLSVLPSMVSGNTNAAAMAIGWRAAELIAARPAVN